VVIAVRSHLLCIAALVTSLGTMCFADTLRVMSFNVRYPAKGDGKDRWEVRQDILARTIRLKNPDLIGTQERFYIQGSIGGFGGRTTGRRIDWIVLRTVHRAATRDHHVQRGWSVSVGPLSGDCGPGVLADKKSEARMRPSDSGF